MGNVVRLSSGGQIQVRTGVLSGVGPAGPRGLIGPQGVDGGQGPEGPAGPIGQILQVQSKAVVAGTTNLTPDVAGLVSFGTVAYDDIGCITSSTNFIFSEIGDYLMTGYLAFGSIGGEIGYRQIDITSNINSLLWASTSVPTSGGVTLMPINVAFRTTVANEQVNIYGKSAQAVPIAAGNCVITRVGSGPIGPVGPQGPQGIPGPVGPAGPQGPAGNANSGFSTYADLL